MNNQSGGNVFDLSCLPSGHDQSGGAGLGGAVGQRWLLNMGRNKFARYIQDAVPGEWFADDSVNKVMEERRWRSVTGRRNGGRR